MINIEKIPPEVLSKLEITPSIENGLKNITSSNTKIKNRLGFFKFYPNSIIKNELKITRNNKIELQIINKGKWEGTGYIGVDRECEVESSA